MPLETNFNIDPYFDDFTDAADYYRVLFKPGVAVQVRELNQLQTILQKQIERFGDHVFKSGTIVSGVNFRYIPNYQFIKINDSQVDGLQVTPATYGDFFVKNSANLQARVINYTTGLQTQDPNLNTLYVQYTNSGDSGSERSFANGETLTIFSKDNPIFHVDVNNGGTGFSNSDVVVFISALDVNITSGTFAIGETITQATTGARASVIQTNTTAIPNKTLLKIKPLLSDLANTAASSSVWEMATGYNVVGSLSSAVAAVNGVVGIGATGIVTTDSLGVVTSIVVNSNYGVGEDYVIPPFVTIKPTSSTAAVNVLDLSARNYKAQITIANSQYTTPVGNGYGFAVTEGVIYQKGHFLKVEPQVIIVDKYSSKPDSLAVGFATDEIVDDVNANTSLYDNAANTTNLNAPGADRLKLAPSLKVVSSSNAAANVDFFTLVEFKEGAPYKENRYTVYNALGDEFARRTQETNGDFVIDPFLVISKDRDTISTSNNFLVVDPGLAYISGYRVQTLHNTYLNHRKATDTTLRSGQVITTSYGNYVRVNQLVGNFGFKSGDVVSLYDTPQTFITSRRTPSSTSITPTGSVIGTARIRSLVHDTGEPGTPEGIYKLYLFDIKMNTGHSFKNTKSIYYNGTNDGICDTVTEYSATSGTQVSVLKDTDNNSLIFDIGQRGTKVANDVVFTYKTTDEAAVMNSSGSLTLSLITTGETFPYNPGTNLTSSQKQDIIIVPLANAASAANLAGAVTTTTTNNIITGQGTTFASDFAVGDWVYLQASVSEIDYRRVVSIANNTAMTVDANVSYSSSVAKIKHFYPAFYPIPFNSRSNRVISAGPNSTTLNININDTLSAPVTVAATYNVVRSNASQSTKTINRDLYVKIDTSNNAANTIGPWCIGVPDVVRLKHVYLGSNTSDQDVTKHFFINQGHDANHYGLSYLAKQADSALTLSSGQQLLVHYDALLTSQQGYRSVSSYNIDDTKTLAASSNTINTFEIPEVRTADQSYYDLRDCFDFRPFVTNTVAYSTSSSSPPVNPANTEVYATDVKMFPAPDSDIVFDTEVYMGRTDRVIAGKDGVFRVIEGAPALFDSRPPQKPSDSITLAIVDTKPYPSLPLQPSQSTIEILDKSVGNESGTVSLRAGRHTVLTANLNIESSTQPQTYTMNDIGNLERRIQQLEYYTSLSMLEQDVKNLSIPSSADPTINRFKNGFFVDDMVDYSFADQYNNEFKADISQERQTLQPVTRHLNLEAMFNRRHAPTSSAIYDGRSLLLPYTKHNLIEQRLASSVVGSDGKRVVYAGSITPSPSSFSIKVRGEVTVTPDPQPCCFDPDAAVMMADGSTKRICEIEVGDRVVNQQGGINNVTGIEAPVLGDRLMYKFNGHWAFVSEEHPIMTTDGWAAFNPDSWAVEREFIGKLKKIEVGTTIITASGLEVVNTIEAVVMPADYKIYNLLLDGDHTYYVESVLVHNKCCFDPDAAVTMAGGTTKRICEIEVGDVVQNQQGSVNNVTGIEAPVLGDRLMYKFNEHWAFVSEDHPILTADGWAAFDPDSWAVEAEFVGKLKKIEIGTTIMTASGPEVVTSIEAVVMPADYKIYNLMLDGDHTYIVENVIVHNKSIICTKLHQLGMLADDLYTADSQYGLMIKEQDPEVYNGYISWARIVVGWMEGKGPYVWPRHLFNKSKRIESQQRAAIKWSREIASPWAEEMAYRVGAREQGNTVGKVLMSVGMPICKLLGKFNKTPDANYDKPVGLVTGYALLAVLALLKCIAFFDKNKGNK